MSQQRPTAKRSPSILVTDSRSKKTSAPFAGTAFNHHNKSSIQQRHGGQRRGTASRFSDISISNILSDVSDVPSAKSREERRSSSFNRMSLHNSPYPMATSGNNVGMRGFQALPPRTSKTSQKLVLIPDDEEEDSRSFSSSRRKGHNSSTRQLNSNYNRNQSPQKQSRTSRNRQKHEDTSKHRLTAYLVSSTFHLTQTWNFLEETHNISPRLYDETLYCPYILPLLPNSSNPGFRVTSSQFNNNLDMAEIIEGVIDSSERRDHHYEYYSGQETQDDDNGGMENIHQGDMDIQSEHSMDRNENNNGSNDIINNHNNNNNNNTNNSSNNNNNNNNNSNNNDDFDPSEPQSFDDNSEHQHSSNNMNRTNSTGNSNITKPSTNLAEMFIFQYGVVVFWNFTEQQEKNILADISFARYNENPNLSIKTDLVQFPLDEMDIEMEQFHFRYTENEDRPKVYNDIITLRSGDHLIKLTLSHAIAQSTKLSRFESRIEPILSSVSKLPKRLALTGKLGLKREQLLKKSGKLFKLRVDVNLSSNVLDMPEFFWSFEPSLHPLYTAMREYLEIEQRVEVLNDRCKVYLEFIDIVVDSIAERNMTRISYIIITVFLISVIVSMSEIFIRYMIIDKIKKAYRGF